MKLLGLYNYWVFIFLMMVGFYAIISRGNLIKKVVGLGVFQTSVFIFYISLGKVRDGTPPILLEDGARYSNPLPHVLILTAIVVGGCDHSTRARARGSHPRGVWHGGGG